MQAQHIENVAEPVSTESVERAESQKVQMSRSELELYVREGRPTGLLLSSVAALKGMTAESVARSSGIPAALVDSIFRDHGVASIKKGSIKRVAGVLGIDLSVMRFAAGQVHVFNLAKAPGGKAFRIAVRGIGLLARGAHVAELKVGTGLRSLMWRGKMHVVQNDTFRALIVSAGGKRFDPASIPSSNWVCGSRENSIVPIENDELARNLVQRDLTEGEFDELFQGTHAATWDDVRVASRINGVTKADLLRFIESRAHELDQSEDDQAKREVMEARPFLRLVDNEQRALANGA